MADDSIIPLYRMTKSARISFENLHSNLIRTIPAKRTKEEDYRQLKYEFLNRVSGRFKDIPGATEMIVDYILTNNHLYTTKDDNKSEMWVYQEGIYVPNGKSEVKEIVRDILEEHFNSYFLNIILGKIEADTFIESKDFFKHASGDEVPVMNGILNVRTRKLSEFTPNKIFFSKIPVSYDKDAVCVAIDRFLGDVLSKDEDKLVFYELAGYGLLNDSRFEKAAMFVGNGRNGKGKSIELLKRLIGPDNCCSIPLASLQPESFQIAELFGKRMNLAGDIGREDLKDISMFKTLTGRDLVTVKRKFLSGLTFENNAKFVFACNELPAVYDTTRAFWDRWILLDFPYTFVSKEELEEIKEDKEYYKLKDEDIIRKIATEQEMSGFLNFALDGLDRLIKNRGFSQTIGSKEIKDMWIRKSNSVVAFILDCVENDSEGWIVKRDFRKKYSDYCKKHGVPSKSDIAIKIALQTILGATDEKKTIGSFPNSEIVWVWEGIKWKKGAENAS